MYDDAFIRLTLLLAVIAGLLTFGLALRAGSGPEEAFIKMGIALVASGVVASLVRQAASVEPPAKGRAAAPHPGGGAPGDLLRKEATPHDQQ